MADVAVCRVKRAPGLERPPPVRRARRRVRVAQAVRIAGEQPDLTLLRVLDGQRQVRQVLAGDKRLFVDVQAGPERDAALRLALLHDLRDHRIQVRVPGPLLLPGQVLEHAVVKHAAVEADEVALFAVYINEVHPSGKLQTVKFLSAHLFPDQLAQLLKRFGTVVGILRGQAADALLFAHQARAQHLGQRRSQAHVDRLHCAVKIARPLALHDILRQRHAQGRNALFHFHRPIASKKCIICCIV